jgi:alpha-galactosidase
VWLKPLSNGAVAVLLFNRGSSPATISASAEQLGTKFTKARVRDLWAHKDKGRWGDSINATVAPHDVAMFTVTPL